MVAFLTGLVVPGCAGTLPVEKPAPGDPKLADEGSDVDPAVVEDAGAAASESDQLPALDAGTIDEFPSELSLDRRNSAADLNAFYERLAGDLRAGKPMVVTVYVALCDNDSQGIIPVRNRSICDGDHPMQNMYWAGKNALAGMAKKQRWKKVSRVEDPDGTLMVEQIWEKWAHPGPGLRAAGVDEPFKIYVIGRAYRGNKIHNAFVDYLRAVHNDDALSMDLDGTTISYGGAGHVVGYVGHDYMMDVEPGSAALREIVDATRGDSSSAKGVFALACAGDSWIRPFISRENVYVMALNVYLAFPNAWTIDGILDGIADRGDGADIHRSAAKGFAKGQECGVTWARKALNHGPKPSE